MKILNIDFPEIVESNKIAMHNRHWYFKTYKNLVERAKSRGIDKNELPKDKVYEIHHILPKCMGGDNNSNNLCCLTLKEHLIAHLLLNKIYPDHLGLIHSCSAMLMNNNREVSSSTILSIRESYYSNLREISKQQVGKIVSNETKQKQKISHIGGSISQSTKDKLNEKRHRVIIQGPSGEIYETIKDACESLSIPRSTFLFWLKNKPEKGFKKIQDIGSIKREVIGPDGTEYSSITECAKKLKRDFKTIKKWIEKYPELGYKYK